MDSKNIVGNIYYKPYPFPLDKSKYGIDVFTMDNYGNAWSIDIERVSPKDLRVLADFLEGRLIDE